MESLETKQKQMNLSTEEDVKIQVDEETLHTELQKGKTSMIGKLHIDRKISKDVVRITMTKDWKPMKPLSVLEINSNVFIFSFEIEDDMQRVMNRRPWLFETSLLSLKPFDSCTPVTKMGFSTEVFWVQIHELPIGCMDERIGTDIGKLLGMSNNAMSKMMTRVGGLS